MGTRTPYGRLSLQALLDAYADDLKNFRNVRAMEIRDVIDDKIQTLQNVLEEIMASAGNATIRDESPGNAQLNIGTLHRVEDMAIAALKEQPSEIRAANELTHEVLEAAKGWLVAYEEEVRNPEETEPCKRLVAAVDALNAAPQAGLDFNTEANLHADTAAERYDATVDRPASPDDKPLPAMIPLDEARKLRCPHCREGYPFTEKSQKGSFEFHQIGEYQLPCAAADLSALRGHHSATDARDATRYRWLRNHPIGQWTLQEEKEWWPSVWHKDAEIPLQAFFLDDAVDAAMARSGRRPWLNWQCQSPK